MLKSGINKPLWRSFIFGSCILQDKTVGETMRKAVFVLVLFVVLFALVSCCGDSDPEFNLILDANDGSGTSSTIRISASDRKVPACPFTRDGYGLAVWNTKQDGSGTVYRKGDVIPSVDNYTLYAQWGIALKESTTEWTTATYALDRDVTISERVVISGDATLYLSEGYTLIASEGINVPGESSITIDGSGVLNAIGQNDAAIGGNENERTGTIVINGGTINATTKYSYNESYGAAIGSGQGGVSSGTILIHGGTVTAVIPEGSSGAGIGAGHLGFFENISISGGKVTARGGNSGAGIGGCESSGGNITISGGVVDAIGGGAASGIGGGAGSGGNINISGGIVSAIGGLSSAGIGGGQQGDGGTITISGGTVVAIGGDCETVGIGGGYKGSDGTLNLDGVSLKVSSDNLNWTDYDGSNRMVYMKTVDSIPIIPYQGSYLLLRRKYR